MLFRSLVFPHHENELAQSSGATGEPFVRYWLHHAFVRIDREKMSKSLGNVFTIQEVLGQVEPEGLRLHLLQTHYRSPLDFSAEGIAESTRGLVRAYETLARAEEAGVADPHYTYESPELRSVVEAMDDDFNTAKNIGLAFESVRELNWLLDAGDTEAAAAPYGVIRAAGASIGLFLRTGAEFLDYHRSRTAGRSGVDAAEIETLIVERSEARKSKDFARADEIRDTLADGGVILEDGPEGTTWKLAD